MGGKKPISNLDTCPCGTGGHEGLLGAVSRSTIPNTKLMSTGRPCSFCGQLGQKWCSACKIPYCSRDCQRNDWPKHRHVCSQQPLSQRKPATPSDTSGTCMETATTTCMETATTLPATANPVQQATPVLPHVPCEDSEHSNDEPPTLPALAKSDQQGERISDRTDQEGLKITEAFDVQNAEKFAQMIGFDLNPVKVVENSEDSDSSDTVTSPSLISNRTHKDTVPRVSLQHAETGQLGSNLERQVHKPNAETSIALESISTSEVNVPDSENSTPERPTCAKGHKRFFIKQLQMENTPSEDFEVVVTEVDNPSCLWVQLFSSDALERRNQLKNILQESYCDSPYEKYVPSVGEVCVAQFTFDNCWYRVKVDMVNNTGTLRVTYIDFGNHEDIAVDKVRRITEDLVSFPRQALKLSLYGIRSASPSGHWSLESIIFLKSEILSERCKVQVCGQHNEIIFVKLSAARGRYSGETINENLMKAGFAETRSRGQQVNRSQGPDDVREQQKAGINKSSYESNINAKRPLNTAKFEEGRNPPRNYRGSQTNKEPFEIVVNAIVNPWEFYVMKTDKQLLDKLGSLMKNLNQHLSENPCTSQCAAQLSPGDICAAQFSLDKVWYRAVILERVPDGYRVRYMDFGNSEEVQDGGVWPLPEEFQHFPPLSLTCSLAGVKKPKPQGWSPEAIQQFKSLVADKAFLCRTVYTHGVANIVELLDPSQGGEQTIANSLIHSGLADAFNPKDGRKRQTDAKRGLPFVAPQQLRNGGTSVNRSPSDVDIERSPFSQQRPNFPGSCERGSLLKDDRSGTFKSKGIESAVFEPAIQAAVLPQSGLPRGQFEGHFSSALESLVYYPAIHSAILPQDKSLFDVMVTEVTKSGFFFIQVADLDTAQNLKKLSEEMNASYYLPPSSSYRPQPNHFCAAQFTGTGDWCRAFIKEVSSEHLVEVHYVDYGNTEKLPVSSIRPLMDNFTIHPFFALPCSLANVRRPESPGWPDEVMELIKEKVPQFKRVNAKVIGKRRGMLFLDFIISKDQPQYLSQLLLNEGFAQRSVRSDRQHDGTRRGIQMESSRPQDSVNDGSSSRSSGSLESLVFEPAIQSVADYDSFDAMLTEVVSPSSLFIQILSHETVESMKQLSANLNAHYNSATYPPFSARSNVMCTGLFSESGDWCRAFIKSVNADGSVHLHYLDYGNSEVLSSSQVRPLENKFQELPPMALKCSLSRICPVQSTGWSDDAREALLLQVPLFNRVKVKVIRKENGSLVIDAASPHTPEQVTLSQFLVNQGMAQWQDLPSAPKEDVHASTGEGAEFPPQLAQKTVLTDSNRFYASEIPLADISQSRSFQVLISEVQRPDRIFFQVVSEENAQGLAVLSQMLNTHCSEVDNCPYKPVLGELCCARFSQDGMWYRAAVEQEFSESRFVLFVDFGNQDSVAVDSIRQITAAFTELPLQARQCFLTGIHPISQSSWSCDAVNYLKGRLSGESFIAEIEYFSEKDVGVQLFEPHPSTLQPRISINQEMVQRILAGSQEQFVCTKLQAVFPNEDQFDVVITEIIHPGEIWGQVLDAESHNKLSLLMEQINQHCISAPVPAFIPSPSQECCALFSLDNTWYRARVLECSEPGKILVQYVDFGNSELILPDKIRPMKDEFFALPAQALKFSLANIRPVHQIWNQEAVDWLKKTVNRKLKVKVVNRLPDQLDVLLEDWNVSEDPLSINEELLCMRFAVKC